MAARDSREHATDAVKSKILLKGMAVIDRRSSAAKAIVRWRKAVIDDLGGPASLSAQQLTLVELAARTKLVLDHLDAALFARTSLVKGKQAKAVGLVADRMKVADSLVRSLLSLGLERKPTILPALGAYVTGKYGGETPGGGPRAARPTARP